MKNFIKENWFGVFILVILFISGIYFINHYFEKKIEFRSFEECLSTTSNLSSNWLTRKATIDFCLKEIH